MADIAPGHVIGQYFGIFHGCSKEHYDKIVASAPFEHCNLLILAFVRLRQVDQDLFIAKFVDGRDNDFNGGHAVPGDTDDDRVRLVMKTARAKNPTIKILVSLGYYYEVIKASVSPQPVAESLANIAKTYGFDGFDIDYEVADGDRPSYPFGPSQFINLMQYVRRELAKVTREPPILTITPAMTRNLTKEVLECFTYTMPQSYDHGGNDTKVWEYQQILNSYDRIVFGLNGEGYLNDPDPKYRPDDPAPHVSDMKDKHGAGVFSWRLDTDTIPKRPAPGQPEGDAQLPTFAVANKMWTLMNTP